MRAMVLEKPTAPLVLREVPKPQPGRGQLLVRVGACGVCRTDLHIVDNELPNPKLPLILGHQIVGRIEEIGPASTFNPQPSSFAIGDRAGIPWLGWTDSDWRKTFVHVAPGTADAATTQYIYDQGNPRSDGSSNIGLLTSTIMGS
jgi:D-arabinose 1-dehydrogenase-like Zn-dependent alcohol dehydrogenase